MTASIGPKGRTAARVRDRAVRVPAYSRVCFVLALVWLVFEYARPAHPLKIPMIASLSLFAGWLVFPRKHWPLQVKAMLGLIALLAVGVPLASNTFAAYSSFKGMTIILAFVGIPIIHFVNTAFRMDWFCRTLLIVLFYVGLWGVTHGGYGPGGASGAQDENYTSMYMCIALPIAFFGFAHFKGMFARFALSASIVVSIACIVVSFSRGGFVGLCAVAIYIWARSSKKWIGAVLVVAALVAMVPIAGTEYWSEMSTITDAKESTADLRLDAWRIAWRQFADNPLLGVGAGNYIWRMGEYQGADLWVKHGRDMTGNMYTHSMYFELLAELGVAGLLLISVFVYSSIRDVRWVAYRCGNLSQTARRSELNTFEWVSRSLEGAMIAYLICTAFLSSLYLPTLWLLGSACAAARLAATRTLCGAAARSMPRHRTSTFAMDGITNGVNVGTTNLSAPRMIELRRLK